MTNEKQVDWLSLSKLAWNTRQNARILGKTRVGAAVLSEAGKTYAGCNIEHKYRSHDIHAETNAISNMIAEIGESSCIAILVVAEREKFTPCGACMDWIFEFGGPDCLVGFQSKPGEHIQVYKASELMPHYPS